MQEDIGTVAFRLVGRISCQSSLVPPWPTAHLGGGARRTAAYQGRTALTGQACRPEIVILKNASTQYTRSEGASGSTFALSTFRAARRLVLIFAVSRALGLLREVGIAAYFGTSASADRIGIAFVISSLATTVVSEAVGAAAIARLGHDRQASGSVYAWAQRSLPAATVCYLVLSMPVAGLVTSGDRGNLWEAPLLAASLAPCLGTAMLSAVGGALLTIEGRIGRITAAQACWSAGSLAGIAVVVAGWHSPFPVVLGWSVGNVVGFVVVRSGVHISTSGSRPRTIDLIRPGLSVALAYSLLSFQSITDRIIASRLQTGAIAALGYADRFHLIPVGFIFTVYGPAVLGDLVSRGRTTGLRASQAALHLERLVRVATPLALLAVAFGPVILHVVLSHGQFGAKSRTLTLGAYDGLMCGIVATALMLVLLRVTQAAGSRRGLLLVTGISVAGNLILTLGLSLVLGIAGIALATSVVTMLGAAVQTKLLARHLGSAWYAHVARTCLVPASAVLAVAGTVSILSYEKVLSGEGRVVICAAGMVATLAVQRVTSKR